MAKLTSNINSSLLNTSMGVLGKLMKTEKVPTLPDLENIFTKNEKSRFWHKRFNGKRRI